MSITAMFVATAMRQTANGSDMEIGLRVQAGLGQTAAINHLPIIAMTRYFKSTFVE
jgi:hypothetical protein